MRNPGVFTYSDYPNMLIEDLRRRVERAETALAERDKPCVCGVTHHGMILHGNRYCPNCGHPIEVK